MKITEWLDEGNLSGNVHDEIKDTDQLMEAAGRALDACYSHEIVGNVIFKGEDGEYYVMTVEAIIGKANPDFIREFLEEQDQEREEED